MEIEAPPGFTRADLGSGFGARFGQVFLDRSRRLLGFRVAEEHANPIGTCHGGAMTTFADLQLMAIRAGREEGLAHSPTISLSVDFLAPAQVGDWVQAEVTLLQQSQTLLFTQAMMTVEGRPVARANAIYRNYNPVGG